MAKSQLRDREAFGYPPFSRLITLTLRHSSPELVFRGAKALATRMQELIGRSVSDAHAPAVSHVADIYIMEIMVRIERNDSPSDIKGLIREAVGELAKDKVFRRISVTINVDPQ
jgi:primosomal protein N' (replication factor Y)